MSIEVIGKLCNGCGACERECTTGVMKVVDGHAQVVSEHEANCMACQHCVAVCPQGAVKFNDISVAECVPSDELPIPVPSELVNLYKFRRAIRQYADEEIPREEIEDLLAAVEYAPTGCNIRELTFTVINGRERIATLRRQILAILAKHNDLPDFLRKVCDAMNDNPELDVFFRNAPHLLIVSSPDTTVTPLADSVIACTHFDLLAQCAGYGTCWCGFLSIIINAAPEVADLFDLRGRQFYAMMFGVPAVDFPRAVNRANTAKRVWL